VCFFDLVVGKARLRYRSLLFTTNFKVALQVESTIFAGFDVRISTWKSTQSANEKWKMKNAK
jgi:hypothetical protein